MEHKQLYELMEKFSASDIAMLKIESDSEKITMKKAHDCFCDSAAVPQLMPTAVPGSVPSPADPAPTSKDTETITSPIIGTFYRSPAPDAPVFIDEGSKVKAGDSLCIIEAMKIMNKLEAEFSCEIVKILAENGQMVEFKTPLFEVKRIQG
ncbi:MAG: acetyl-CoA carboxylase, biotin carboxyl carrier protein [Spirochaeta sp. LUC14_002_19_P3]|nr:MAG: acetyl-CoA carboxylase, biotin carboxyl carrier protein [Spirochaeta sp. LUC14_002_19_P3]